MTIGKAEKPETGALLQLKNKETEDNGANANKGLLLPRVKLTSMTSLVDISKADTESDSQYIGLVVYNTEERPACYTDDFQRGIHIWSGDRWNNIGASQTVAYRKGTLVDTRTGDDTQTYATVHIKLSQANGTLVYEGEWMSENLRASVYANNITPKKPLTLIGGSDDAQQYVPMYRYNKHNNSDFDIRGYYYNTFAVFNDIDMTDIDVHAPNVFIPSRLQQGICPEGWRVPTYEDWTHLRDALDADESCYYIKPVDKTVTYNKLDGAFSRHDQDFASAIGYAGISRSLEEGGLNIYSDGKNGADPMASYWMAYPSPWSTYDTPFSSPAHVLPQGIATVVQMSSFAFMPVRCIKGDIPAQRAYDPRWNYMLPNDVDRNVTNPNPPSGRNANTDGMIPQGSESKIIITK